MGQKSGRRRRSPQETETLILQAAEQVFGDKGYFDATVAEIVERAEISRGAFYLYFEDKEKVYIKLLQRVVDNLFMASTTPGSGSLRERVETANRQYLEAFARERHVLRSLYQAAATNPEIAALHRGFRTRFLRRIKAHIERNIARGRCHPMDAEVAASALGAMVEGFGVSWLASGFEPWPEPMRFERVVQELTNLWCRAIYTEEALNPSPRTRPSGG